jgi:hypothetical protein
LKNESERLENGLKINEKDKNTAEIIESETKMQEDICFEEITTHVEKPTKEEDWEEFVVVDYE